MKVLFGVFDWGLGHATRDTPLIEELLRQKCKVDIISTGRALSLLKNRFGRRCNYFDVPSIYVPYSKSRFFSLFFGLYIPRMMSSLKRARKITEGIIASGKYDKVISDCRYDVYDRVDNSYLINHQLRFKSFYGVQEVFERWLYSRMKKYKYVLVPDFPRNSLSGDLSHNLNYIDKSRVKYLGIISHLNKRNVKKDIDFFISISGPEPQRTVFEKKIIPELCRLTGKIVVTLGKPEKKRLSCNKSVKFYSFLNSRKQEEMMNRAKFVITRSGYTTMMELAELDITRALLIPTPGQTEQEYLSEYYIEKGFFYSQSQYKLDLLRDIDIAKMFHGFKKQWKTNHSVKKFMRFIKE